MNKRICVTGITCLALSLLVCFGLQAQMVPNTPSPGNVVPPSPTAASLGKYGAIPVSTYTGIPNISVPVYTIQSGSLTLPISLSYHASGIRVSEEASWVGLGWSLFSGGTVTRSIRGLDDFHELTGVGYPDYVFPLAIDEFNNYEPSSAAPWNELSFLRDVNAGIKDPEPDIFYYNFDGHSGRFTIAQRSNSADPYEFNIESQEKIKIELYQEGTDKVWIFTTIDGKKYRFKTPEKIKTYSYSISGIEPSPDLISSTSEPVKRTSTWYLDEMTAPDGNAIFFEYTAPSETGTVPCASRSESRSHLLYTQINGSYGCSPESPSSHMYYTSHNVVFDVYLKRISFSNGQIVFETSARNDIKPISPTSLPQKLDKVLIYKKNGESFEQIKSVNFTYDYFMNFDPNLNYNIGNYSYNYSKTYSSKRLKLLKVTEKNGSSEMPPTSFEYITTNYAAGDIPDKYSKSQDYWGYFNNALNTTVTDQFSSAGSVSTLLPSYTDLERNVLYNGANRAPDNLQMQLGTLSKITYPTGGSTEFRYGINEYGNFPPEYVAIAHNEFALAYGNQVNPFEEPAFQFWDPDLTELPPSVIQFTLPKTTTVSLTIIVGYSYLWDCENYPSWDQPSVGIRSVGTTPSFNYATTGNLQCYSNTTVSKSIVLPAGTYELVSSAADGVLNYVTVSWLKQTQTPVQLPSKKGGGLRVESVIDYDGLNHDNDIITTYKYTHTTGGVEKTSGVLMSPIFNEYKNTLYRSMSCSNGGVYYTSTYLNRSSESVIPLGSSAQGKTIGYSSVTVSHGSGGVNGKSVFTYRNEPERLVTEAFPTFPTTPNPSNGLLLSQTDYKYNPNISQNEPFQKVKELTREYVHETNYRKVTKGLKCQGCEFIYDNQMNGYAYIPIVKFYDNLSEWWHLSKETIRQYNSQDENSFMTTTSDYFYENPSHLQLTKSITETSKGKITTVLKYPLDYGNITSLDEISAGIAGLKENHILNPVVEKAVYHSDENGNNSRLTEAIFTAYNGRYPTKVFAADIKTPVTNFVSSSVQGGAVVKDPRFTPRLFFDHYGDFSNIVQLHKYGEYSRSYIWDITSSYPTAEVINAEVDDIAYTSFEKNDARYFWSFTGASYNNMAVTGKQSILMAGGTITGPPISASKKYIVSYWTTSPNSFLIAGTQGNAIKGVTKGGWTYFTHIITGQTGVTVLGTGNIDELRLYPEGAQMKTYTYDPLIGMTSETDPTGRTIYYEYDSFNRLKLQKDEQGNILKKYCYNYAGQPIDCN